MTREERVEVAARALHAWAETNFVNKGMRLKWENPVVDRAGYLAEARFVIDALDGVDQAVRQP